MACEDAPRIGLGAEFSSFADVEKAISIFEAQQHINYYRRDTRTIEAAASGNRFRGFQANPDIKYWQVKYACLKGGRKFNSRASVRLNQGTFREDCPSFVRFRASKDGQKLVVVGLEMEHNHPLDPEFFKRLPKQRRLTEEEKEEVYLLMKNGVDKKSVRDHMLQTTQKCVNLRDLSNAMAEMHNLEGIMDTLATEDNTLALASDPGIGTNDHFGKMDVLPLFAGEMFNTFEELQDRVHSFAQKCGFQLRMRSSQRSLEVAGKSSSQANVGMNRAPQFTEIDYFCDYGHTQVNATSEDHAKMQAECTFSFKVKSTSDSQNLLIASLNSVHNHSLCAASVALIDEENGVEDSSVDNLNGADTDSTHSCQNLKLRFSSDAEVVKTTGDIKAKADAEDADSVQSVTLLFSKAVFSRWNSIKDSRHLDSHDDVATLLLDSFMKNEGELPCAQCGARLVHHCPVCTANPSGIARVHPQPIKSASAHPRSGTCQVPGPLATLNKAAVKADEVINTERRAKPVTSKPLSSQPANVTSKPPSSQPAYATRVSLEKKSNQKGVCDNDTSFDGSGVSGDRKRDVTGTLESECRICSHVFDTRAKLAQHKLYHIGRLDCMCSVCGKALADIKSLAVHGKTCQGVTPLTHKRQSPKVGRLPSENFLQARDQGKPVQPSSKRKRGPGQVGARTSDASVLAVGKACDADSSLALPVKNAPVACVSTSKRFAAVKPKISGASSTSVPSLETNCERRSEVTVDEESLTCKICSKRYFGKKQLTAHMTALHSRFTCSTCSRVFRLEASLSRHMLIHLGPKSFTCDVCQKTFRTRARLKQHQFIHTGERNYCCATCGKTFTQKSALLRHTNLHTGRKVYTCDVCQKSFNDSSTMSKHRRRKHGGGESEKRHICDQCGKAFYTMSSLLRHKLIHTGEKPCLCVQCGRSFTDSTGLRVHRLSAHSNARPHACQHCRKVFKFRCALQRHLLTHTGERKHKCTQCQRSFADTMTLKVHVLFAHTSEVPFSCTVCQKGFKMSCQLKRHMFTHSSEKPHVCGKCKKGFNTLYALKKHHLTAGHSPPQQEEEALFKEEIHYVVPVDPQEVSEAMQFSEPVDGQEVMNEVHLPGQKVSQQMHFAQHRPEEAHISEPIGSQEVSRKIHVSVPVSLQEVAQEIVFIDISPEVQEIVVDSISMQEFDG